MLEPEAVHEHAKAEKKKGDEEYLKAAFATAVMHYTRAIALTHGRHPAFIEFAKAEEDSKVALKLDGRYLRAYAFEDFERASKLEPGNTFLREKIQKAKETIAAIAQKKKDSTAKNIKVNKGVLDWMGDTSLVGLDVEAQPSKKGERGTNGVLPPQSGDTNLRPPASVNDVPLLVPVGEALDAYIPDLETLTRREAEEQAMREKELGNDAFVNAQYLVALVHYSRAIKLFPEEAVFFSNRALVYLKLNRFYESITDCTASIDRKPSIKAFARRAAAWVALKEYILAADDYRKALRFEPKNQDCLDKLGRCLMHIEEEYMRKLQSNPSNDKLKKDLQKLRDDIRKIGSALEGKQTTIDKAAQYYYHTQANFTAPPVTST
ncbi:tetratricopeptide repeat domain containing protein [Acanthamoeba castellanii str. Neff]|uniref:Tetratricopeptide repeat domain containing protein n=1 Tax=Acanthamoeba castellanii (strain ATCC 30010 / Neff) TaxID=1257118 RepID=L8GRR1_ACACF|nr:tetratricopeptide repeat domain containing protein [Acanthamoeba castellanii str. Neff]ELR15655.1 tetratricopeptide repeat domain containing protein [Acanthamoeba castellanii str. Neff]